MPVRRQHPSAFNTSYHFHLEPNINDKNKANKTERQDQIVRARKLKERKKKTTERNNTYKHKQKHIIMRISLTSVTLLGLLLSGAEAFQPTSRVTTTYISSALKSSRPDLHEFDALLGIYDAGSSSSSSSQKQLQAAPRTGRKFRLPDHPGQRSVILASTTTLAAPGVEDVSTSEVEQLDADPYADYTIQETEFLEKYQEQQQRKVSFEDRLKEMDFQDMVSTILLPSIFGFAALRWGFNKVANRVATKTNDTLDSFANEMIYHDGDFEEMKLCYKDFSKKLAYLGPNKTSAMLKRYLELYAKKKTVSPQSIRYVLSKNVSYINDISRRGKNSWYYLFVCSHWTSIFYFDFSRLYPRSCSSLSHVFSFFQLSEGKAAQILVSLCREMGEEKVASSGKLLFFGSRILKSPEGKAALQPIRDLIKSSYREASVAEEMVEISQQAMAEAAYKSAVLAGGKNQETLTVGWEVLGLDKDTATRIFEEEAKDGFVSDRVKMYGGQTTKYDSKGNIIDKEGTLVDPENAIEGSDDDAPTSNVYECSNCGYTLFVAKGRESKFYGEGFTCPECGAKKDKFKPKDIEED
jgi:rubredoxin